MRMNGKNVYSALRRIEEVVGLEKQLVVRHVTARVTGTSRKQMKDEIEFNTEGHEKADEFEKLVVDLDSKWNTVVGE